MEKTINYTEIDNFWNGKVIIREIKKYTDDRGMVGEIFRIDSDINHDSKMCYISDTNSLVLRGPHQHSKQADVFISWGDDSKMIYQLYNKDTNEMKYFITESNKIYSVTVEPGIIHSYRNISSGPIKTLNFPDALYKGYDKKEEIDEIRHEDLVNPSKNIWVLGAGGRLGKQLVKTLFENMGYHTYNVIPIYEKFPNNKEGLQKLNTILTNINKEKNNIIINCIAKTNVQDENSDFNYENFLLPKFISEFCVKNKIHFITFSTDYVYQTGIVSSYTKSKILFESWISNILDDESMWGYQLTDVKEYIKVIRIANLFSLNQTDIHNVLNKIYNKIKEGKILIPQNLTIMPTSVEALSQYMIKNYIFNLNNIPQVIEVSGKAYDFYTFKTTFLKDDIVEIKENDSPKTANNTELFLNNKNYNEIDCDVDIISKLKNIKDTNG